MDMNNDRSTRLNARVMRPCQWCEQDFSARDMVRHKPRCPQKPKPYVAPAKIPVRRRIDCRFCGQKGIAPNFFSAHLAKCPLVPIQVGQRRCVVCQDPKPEGDFYRHPSRGYQNTCKDCAGKNATEWYKANRERRRRHLRQKHYRLDHAGYEALLDAQHGLCAICQQPPSGGPKQETLHVDHCHETDKVRGLLCTCCNQAIGQLREDPALFLRAIEYLSRHRPIPVVA